jgi:hypothetical protein
VERILSERSKINRLKVSKINNETYKAGISYIKKMQGVGLIPDMK